MVPIQREGAETFFADAGNVPKLQHLKCNNELLQTAAPSRTDAFARALAASPAGATRAVCEGGPVRSVQAARAVHPAPPAHAEGLCGVDGSDALERVTDGSHPGVRWKPLPHHPSAPASLGTAHPSARVHGPHVREASGLHTPNLSPMLTADRAAVLCTCVPSTGQ